jgi:hypothetical protein
MPELICEIGTKSWFYYKEMKISVRRSEVVVWDKNMRYFDQF